MHSGPKHLQCTLAGQSAVESQHHDVPQEWFNRIEHRQPRMVERPSRRTKRTAIREICFIRSIISGQNQPCVAIGSKSIPALFQFSTDFKNWGETRITFPLAA